MKCLFQNNSAYKTSRGLLIVVSLVVIACKSETSNPEALEYDDLIVRNGIDTIPEKSDPKFLDLSKHQLFIDTTRSKKAYKGIYNENIANTKFVSSLLKEVKNEQKKHQIDLEMFTRQWIFLNKIDDEFVIYKPCDGSTKSVVLTNEAIIFSNVPEVNIALISKLNELTKDAIALEVEPTPINTNSSKTEFSIKPTSTTHVYELIYKPYSKDIKIFVTPSSKLTSFNILVNHCPTEKVSEYTFDNY